MYIALNDVLYQLWLTNLRRRLTKGSVALTDDLGIEELMPPYYCAGATATYIPQEAVPLTFHGR